MCIIFFLSSAGQKLKQALRWLFNPVFTKDGIHPAAFCLQTGFSQCLPALGEKLQLCWLENFSNTRLTLEEGERRDIHSVSPIYPISSHGTGSL